MSSLDTQVYIRNILLKRLSVVLLKKKIKNVDPYLARLETSKFRNYVDSSRLVVNVIQKRL